MRGSGGAAAARVPEVASITAGWRAHVSALASVDSGDRVLGQAWTRSVADVLIGPGAHDSLTDCAHVVRARARLGLVAGRDANDDTVGVLLDEQQRSGEIGRRGQDRAAVIDQTTAFVAALGALWVGGVNTTAAESLLLPLAKAATWLDRHLDEHAAPASLAAAADALRSAADMAGDLDQPDLGADLARRAQRRGDAAPRTRRRWAGRSEVDPVDLLGLGGALGVWANGDGRPSVGWSARFVTSVLDGVLATRPDGLAVWGDWTDAEAGRTLDVANIPIRFGRAGVAVRWHGSRPAVLFEVSPWPGRTVAVPLWSAPMLDPSWTARDARGETLLAEPAPLRGRRGVKARREGDAGDRPGEAPGDGAAARDAAAGAGCDSPDDALGGSFS